jgi:hypothetical protein
VQLNVATLAAGQKAAGTATLQPIPGSPNKELVLNLQIPEGAQGKRGVGIADVDLKVTFVEHGETVQTASLTDIPGKEDKRLVLSLQIPMPPPATVDFTTADKRYVQKAGDTMTGTLKVPELEAAGQVFADWLVVGEPGFQNAWSFINPDNGPDLALGPVDPTNLAKLTLTVLEFNRATGLVTVTNDLEVGKGLTVFGAAKLTGDVLVGGKLDTLGLLTARTAQVTDTLRVDGATTLAADASVGQHLEVGGDADITGHLAVNSYVFSKWLVIGAASGSLDGSWGLVQEGGGRVGESGTLRIGTFVNAGEATSGKLHVPVMNFTSTEVTIIQEAKFTRDLTAERDLRVLGLLDAGDVVGRDAEFENVNVARDLTVRGCKFFVQAPPEDPSVEIYYAALEGPEPGTYIRGEAELVAGEAVIELPEHFALVTSSQGLTVQLTPIGEWLQLYVVELSPQRLVVREAQGKDGKFFYLVQGVRKGYEGFQVVREKE